MQALEREGGREGGRGGEREDPDSAARRSGSALGTRGPCQGRPGPCSRAAPAGPWRRLGLTSPQVGPHLGLPQPVPAGPELDPAGPELDPAGPELEPAGPELDPVGPELDPAGPELGWLAQVVGRALGVGHFERGAGGWRRFVPSVLVGEAAFGLRFLVR